MEKALPSEEGEALLAAIVESSEDAIIGKSLEGIVTSWNEGARRLFGFTAEEMLGQPGSRIIPLQRSEEEAHILTRIPARRTGGAIRNGPLPQRWRSG